MAIFHETTAARALSGADLRESEGCFVKKNSDGKLVLCAASDSPLGVIHVPGEQDDYTDFIRPGFAGTVGVRVAASSAGTIVEGSPLVLAASGTVKQASSGKVVAIACEAAEAGQLVEAVLVNPYSLT